LPEGPEQFEGAPHGLVARHIAGLAADLPGDEVGVGRPDVWLNREAQSAGGVARVRPAVDVLLEGADGARRLEVPGEGTGRLVDVDPGPLEEVEVAEQH